MRRTILSLLTALSLLAQQQQDEVPVFRTSSNLVVVTVFVRDRNGKPMSGLKKEDFLLTENGKPQTIGVFDFQQLTPAAVTPVAAASAAVENNAAAAAPRPPDATGSARFRDRRLLVLFFDWSSLQPADQVHAKEAAEKFLKEKLTPSDLVQIVSFGSRLRVDQEFTDNRETLLSVVSKFQTGEMSELAAQGDTGGDGSEDSAFTADDTEFNIFNTDRKLAALEELARNLSALPEKKAVVYFTGGVNRTGDDNQAQIQATVNSAVRSNVSFYPVDVKGLSAEPPGGSAGGGNAGNGGGGGRGGGGTGIFSGATQNSRRQQQISAQDSLTMLAEDTGGKALLDNNELVLGIQQAQDDIQSYYILGYYSSDERKDGQFRRVELKLNPASRLQARLDYRRGYFADKDFKTFNSYDKEKQLNDALTLGDPVTDLRVAMEVNWFRLGGNVYFVPVALKIPGSAIPLKKQGGGETTTFDFIGQVKDSKGAVAANVRDAIKIQLRDEKAGQLGSRSLVYDTGFSLSPGEYRLKMLVRENLTGKMGTFETKFTIPNLSSVKDSARLSAVVFGSQRVPIKEAVGVADKSVLKHQSTHPLVRDKQKLLPSVTHVFRKGQNLFVYAELYDPALSETQKQPAVAASLNVYQGRKLILESRPVAVSALKDPRSGIAPVYLEIPLTNFEPGEYTAQLNVIDRTGQKAAFARAPLVVLAR
ncbi:MAG: VWA domain-containing protein [Acidobacteria bacterium]|nr:VWA domain-containing protein [Acidobacteriota bacterium]